ncbi:hypothetical protein C8Q74DRAFT_1266086 [Fomes fomentarius]|nr:hypothetical protein C8Q74DRAFT_1266086 [Fomes fomentarius]
MVARCASGSRQANNGYMTYLGGHGECTRQKWNPSVAERCIVDNASCLVNEPSSSDSPGCRLSGSYSFPGRDPYQQAALCAPPVDPFTSRLPFSYCHIASHWKIRTRSHRVNSYGAITSSSVSVCLETRARARAKHYAHIVTVLRRNHVAHNPNIECIALHTLCLANVRSRAVPVSILLGLALRNKPIRELLCGLRCSKWHT